MTKNIDKELKDLETKKAELLALKQKQKQEAKEKSSLQNQFLAEMEKNRPEITKLQKELEEVVNDALMKQKAIQQKIALFCEKNNTVCPRTTTLQEVNSRYISGGVFEMTEGEDNEFCYELTKMFDDHWLFGEGGSDGWWSSNCY